MTGRGGESLFPNDGTATRAVLLREAAVENIGQWAKAWTSDAACRKKAFGL